MTLLCPPLKLGTEHTQSYPSTLDGKGLQRFRLPFEFLLFFFSADWFIKVTVRHD